MTLPCGKWTNGPWRFYTEPQPNGCPIIGSGGLMIAMLAHTVRQPEQADEALANARLIASAPDLYDALADLLAAYEDPGNTGSDHDDKVIKACAVLAAARGEGNE